MEQHRREVLLGLLQISDVALNLASLGLASCVVRGVPPLLLAAAVPASHVLMLVVLIFLWHCNQIYFGLYYSRRLSTAQSELWDVMRAGVVNSLLVWLFWGSTTPHVHRSLIALWFFGISLLMVGSARFTMRVGLRILRRHGANLRTIVIFGCNARSVAFAHQITSRPELGYVLAGFIDDGNEQVLTSGFTRVADLSNYAEYLKNNPIDEVTIFLPMNSFYRRIREIVPRCVDMGILVRMDADLFDTGQGRIRVDVPWRTPVITMAHNGIAGSAALVKVVLDRVLALVLLVVLAPVFLVAAIAVRLSSPGPIFFTQKRVGLNKRVFHIFKFRSMYMDAEERQAELERFNERSGPVFKITQDPRVTRVGRWLRRTSIDEFPQLLNVLRGEMSLIGPRPLPLRDYRGFSASWHLRRFSVRPGLSCLWQISGRNDIDFERWMELDMEYIERWSLWLDFKIMAQTIPAVLKGRGAS